MTYFRNDSAEFMQRLKETGKPLVLTVNGRAAAVVRDAEACQRLLDLAASASPQEGLRQGHEDVEHGRIQPAAVALDAIRAEYGIPR